MAKRKKTTEDQASESEKRAVDLLAMLVPPGHTGPHQVAWELAIEEAPPPVLERPAPGTAGPVSPSEPAGVRRASATVSGPGPAHAASDTMRTTSAKESVMPRKSTTVESGVPENSAGRKGASSAPVQMMSGGSSCPGFQPPENDSFERIRADILACTRCELYKTRTNIVPGEGNPKARLVFIGEAPGADEDASGRPFVGRAGQHLDKILTAAGFKREEVFICNILKDRPPDNRTPTVKEMEACTPFLRRQLAIIKPQIIGLLGNTAVKFVIGPEAPGITKIHGQWFESILGIPCMPMYHPSYLLRNQSRAVGSPNWQMWQDIQALKKRYDELAARE